MKLRVGCMAVGFLSLVFSLSAQTSVSSPASSQVPPLIQFSNVATDEGGNTLSGVVSITFSLYNGQQGGEPLWTETQNNVQLDPTGHYSVQLGITKPNGVPTTLFTSGEARWLGVQIAEQGEQPRVLLLSVPYALKAGDAATIGGLPPSAFVLAAPQNGAASAYAGEAVIGQSVSPATALDVTTPGGTVNYLPLWDSTSDIVNSVVFQSATSPFKIGINTATPATTLDVKGAGTIRGSLSLPSTGGATATAGANSQPLELTAAAFNSGTSKAVTETFLWQAEPAGNDTATPSGTLNLLFSAGTSKPAETGLHIASNGQITFATGQTFPGAGTITGITTEAGSGLSGGGTSGILSLKVPAAGITNAMLAGSGITLNVNAAGGLTTPGAMTLGSTYTMGLKACAANQVLQYNGTSWACANAGTGTVTSVESGAGLTGGPITGSGTLSLAANACPASSALSALPFTCSLFATLGANTFTGTQAITGHSLQTYIGDPGCGAHPFAGIAFGSSGFSNCENYSMVGDSVNTYIAAPTGDIYFRTASNAITAMTIVPSGAVNVDTNLVVTAFINSDAGGFTGFSAAAGSSSDGTNGVSGIGGNGDPDNPTDGGVGVQGFGGIGGGSLGALDGPGGYFEGGQHALDGDGVDVFAGSGFAGNFIGNLNVSGVIFAETKDFKIDHPLDPANKYLVHASVESSEMMNIYTGNVTTDSQGHATVQLPEWFEVLNTDFRYQLTVIGQFAQAIVAHEIENNRFEIRTSAPNVKVSWQVTGVRQDAFAKANPLVVEQEKDARLRGFYIHPELYGAPAEKQIEWARHPRTMKKMQEMRARQLAASHKQTLPRN
jgi:trimeric autotransporter adhesin